MLTLRKDVKVGLTLGGVVLAVVVVWLLLTAVAGPTKPNGQTAQLQTTPLVPKPQTTSGSSSASTNKPTATPSPGFTSSGASSVAAKPTSNSPSSGLSSVSPSVPAASNDVWDTAFSTGSVPATATPDPRHAANAQRGTSPNDIVSALKMSPARADAVTPSKESAAGQPSGSIISPTPSQTLTSIPAGGQSYVVLPGDTFSSISSDFYGDAKHFQLLVEANPQVNPNRMKPGVTLIIPAAPAKSERSATAETQAVLNIDPSRQYEIQPGDSLNKIASRLWGDSSKWMKLYETNKAAIGSEPARLKVGTVLMLPEPPTRR